LALEDLFAPEWNHVIYAWRSHPRTGLPIHTFAPTRRKGWQHGPTNLERALRLPRGRIPWLASRAGKEIRASRASGLPISGRGKIGPRGIARRVGDWGLIGVDAKVVAIPSSEPGTLDLAVFVVVVPMPGA
jgi:hypothetical protein